MNISITNNVEMSLTQETLDLLKTNKYFASWYFNNFSEIQNEILRKLKIVAWAFAGADNCKFELYEMFLENKYNSESNLEELEIVA